MDARHRAPGRGYIYSACPRTCIEVGPLQPWPGPFPCTRLQDAQMRPCARRTCTCWSVVPHLPTLPWHGPGHALLHLVNRTLMGFRDGLRGLAIPQLAWSA